MDEQPPFSDFWTFMDTGCALTGSAVPSGPLSLLTSRVNIITGESPSWTVWKPIVTSWHIRRWVPDTVALAIAGALKIGNINSDGVLLLSKCTQHNLIITNTLFRHLADRKSAPSNGISSIDFVIVWASDRCYVNITRATINSDNCWRDHRLVWSTMSIKLRKTRRIQRKQAQRRLNLDGLNDTAILQQLQDCLAESLQQEYPDNIEEHCGLLKSTILDSCESTLGFKSRKYQDWFDEHNIEIEHLISKKLKAFLAWKNDPTNKAKRVAHSGPKAKVQRRVKELKNIWWTEKAPELQALADFSDTRGFFSATKIVYGPSTHGLNFLYSKDRQMLLKDNLAINACWKQHFQEILNRESSAASDIVSCIHKNPSEKTWVNLLPKLRLLTPLGA